MNEKTIAIDPCELYEATNLVLANRPTVDVDAIILHARGFDDEDGLLELVRDLCTAHGIHVVVTNGSNGEGMEKGKKIWVGFPQWKEWLIQYVPPETWIIASPGPCRNTLEESQSFIETAARHDWKSVIVVAQPHQLLRSMLGALKELSKRELASSLRLYSVSPQSVNWRKSIQASQCEVRPTRFHDISAEFRRISKYVAKGDLAPLGELITYLTYWQNVQGR